MMMKSVLGRDARGRAAAVTAVMGPPYAETLGSLYATEQSLAKWSPMQKMTRYHTRSCNDTSNSLGLDITQIFI